MLPFLYFSGNIKMSNGYIKNLVAGLKTMFSMLWNKNLWSNYGKEQATCCVMVSAVLNASGSGGFLTSTCFHIVNNEENFHLLMKMIIVYWLDKFMTICPSPAFPESCLILNSQPEMIIKITHCCQNFIIYDKWRPVKSENMRKVIKSDNFLVKGLRW